MWILGTNLIFAFPQKADEEAKLLAMSKPEIIKVIHEEASKAGIDPKILESEKVSHEFNKIQDAKMKVLNREYSQMIKKAIELKRKKLDLYMWTATNRLKPEPITNVKIHPNTKPTVPSFRKRRTRLSRPKNVPFVNNMVIEEPEYEMLFIDVFGDEAFYRMNDIHKVNIETLLTYLVMASNITTPENTRFFLKLRKLIENHPD
ncbi:hypothetical protein Tco_1206843 [Tanacetum coccineum]